MRHVSCTGADYQSALDMLPSIIQSRYELARSRFDRSDYKAAVEGFTEVLVALSDPDIAGAAKGPPLSDLRVLAAYDPIVLAAAKRWAYRPAMRSGGAVKYRKRIQLTLPRQTNCRGIEGCS